MSAIRVLRTRRENNVQQRDATLPGGDLDPGTGPHLDQNVLVPWIFDYYTKLGFSPAHKIHKIHALRRVSASSALSSFFCYRGLADYATVALASILGLSGGLSSAAGRPCQRPFSPLAQTWHSKIAIRDEYRK